MAAFDEQPVERWDHAVFLQISIMKAPRVFLWEEAASSEASPELLESAVMPLIIHGLPKELQRQVQVKSPKTAE